MSFFFVAVDFNFAAEEVGFVFSFSFNQFDRCFNAHLFEHFNHRLSGFSLEFFHSFFAMLTENFHGCHHCVGEAASIEFLNFFKIRRLERRTVRDGQMDARIFQDPKITEADKD